MCAKMVFYLRAVYLVVFVTLATVMATQDPEQPNLGVLGAEARNLLGQVRTTTLWDISIATSTAYFSCLSGTFGTGPCNGKRRRKRQSINNEYFDNNQDLLGSLESGIAKDEVLEFNRSGKLYGFTVWTQVTQSSTVTVLTTNTATTLRLSYYCTAALATGPSAACP